ncbi:DUF5686 and carboxypeptidase regulatory-like domain-containing protein [Marinilabiliaceae bacterium ANBcel2]|nr:DUF5686 and carboxypeptidase regulatory-like domain-containing protein [Marinilabiliaceae bacterium ANBcel2]
MKSQLIPFLYKPLHLILIYLCSCHIAEASGLKGQVTNLDNEPIPGVSIFIKESHSGVATNNEGFYELKLEPGTYHVIFQALGYSRQEFQINITEKKWLKLDVILNEVQVHLQEVRVYPGEEDPAYTMMRKAIGLAPYYLRQAKEYEAEVYLRGSLQVNRIPLLLRSNILVNDLKIKSGDTYTAESMNIIHFAAPDTFNHTVVDSRSSFPVGDESSPIGYISYSFYESNNDMYISPLATNAMRHYRFQYEGYITEGDHIINRIRVIPRRKSQQLFEGVLYLVEDFWNIHSLNFTLEAFYGTVRMQQLYSPVQNDIWLPVNHQFEMGLSIMGIQADVNYIGSVKYLDVKPNRDLVVPELITRQVISDSDIAKKKEKPLSPNQKRIEALLEKEELSNREMVRLASSIEKESISRKKNKPLEIQSSYSINIKKDSIQRDSINWKKIRPVPLTRKEEQSFAIRDSINAAQTKTSQTDSTEQQTSTFKKIRSAVFSKSTLYRSQQGNINTYYGGLIDPSAIGFNAVDGWRYHQKVGLNWQQDSLHRMNVELNTGYALARESLYGSLTLRQNYLPMSRGAITLSAGADSYDFKNDKSVLPFVNMGASLLFKENYNRYYENNFVSLKNEVDLANGFQLTTAAAWHHHQPLENNTNYSFFRQNSLYHPNQITHLSAHDNHFKKQKALITELGFEYTPRYYYRVRNGRKIMSHSNYPTFSGKIEYGSGLFNSDADYLLVEAGIQKQEEFSFMPTLSWKVNAGNFFRNKQMHFSRFRDFEGTDIPVLFQNPGNSFLLMDGYSTSTNKWFLQAHTTYSSPWLLLKNLPIISNRIWNENLHLNYLHTPENPHYIQAGYSISRIFMAGTIAIYTGFSEGKYQHWGVRVAIAGW